MEKQAALDAIQSELQERASTVDVRRVVYSHDMGTLPDVVKKFITTMPDMVVQPETQEEVRHLVTLAKDGAVPLVLRGSAGRLRRRGARCRRRGSRPLSPARRGGS